MKVRIEIYFKGYFEKDNKFDIYIKYLFIHFINL